MTPRAAMGCAGGSQKDLPPLPQQQVVHDPAAASKADSAKPKEMQTQGVKISLIWDKASLSVARLGDERSTKWRLAAKFTAEVACEALVALHCSEAVQANGTLRYSRPQSRQGPPEPNQQHFEAGSHELALEGDFAIDLMQWPFEVFWKYRAKQASILPIVLQLQAADNTQSVLIISLKLEGGELQPVLLRQRASIRGQAYTMQEVFGLADMGADETHDESKVGEPCVVCLSETRCTAILPCMHLCVCSDCGKLMRQMAEKQGASTRCPICRGPIDDLKIFEVTKRDKGASGERRAKEQAAVAGPAAASAAAAPTEPTASAAQAAEPSQPSPVPDRPDDRI